MSLVYLKIVNLIIQYKSGIFDMKAVPQNRTTLFIRFFFLIIVLNYFSINLKSQDLDVNQTLDYINKKFEDFPYQNQYDLWSYKFSITPNGELCIVQNGYMKGIFESDRGTLSLVLTYTYKIAIDKIDTKESFETYHYNESQDNIYLYPSYDGNFYEESIDSKGIQQSKKTVPASAGLTRRNSISLLLGDAGNKQNILNALSHLCTLINSDPAKYGLNKKADPFENINITKKAETVIDENTSAVIISKNSSDTIKITKSQSGLIEIPIVLNDVLRINFIFDSGASEVSLSPDVALTLIRTGTISENDWLPSKTYTFADGSKAKSKRFLIKKLIIGNQVLTNIEASISNSIEAPMIIGQNVMKKLGSVTIDNRNQLLIIKSK